MTKQAHNPWRASSIWFLIRPSLSGWLLGSLPLRRPLSTMSYRPFFLVPWSCLSMVWRYECTFWKIIWTMDYLVTMQQVHGHLRVNLWGFTHLRYLSPSDTVIYQPIWHHPPKISTIRWLRPGNSLESTPVLLAALSVFNNTRWWRIAGHGSITLAVILDMIAGKAAAHVNRGSPRTWGFRG